MKILFITTRFPYPPFRGDKLRVFNLVKELSRDHEVVLATFAEADDGRYFEDLKKYVKRIERAPLNKPRAYFNCLTHLFSSVPLQVSYYQSPQLKRAVDRLIKEEKPDIIHAHLIRTAPYALAYPGIPKVLDICDSMTLNYERFLAYRKDIASLLYRIEKAKTRTYESTVPAEFDANLVVSAHDRSFIFKLCPEARLEIVPMGVDFDYFRPADGDKIPNRVVFTGTMSYFPNVDAMRWFTRDVLPLIRRAYADIELYIVGSNPTPEVTKLADDPAVTVTGYVDDVRPYIGPAAVFVCPIRAATGLNTKIIQAMAMGLPVVATPEAGEGIDATDGENILLASEPMVFAEAVTNLLRDQALRDRIGAAGREFVLSTYGWDKAAKTLTDIYRKILPKAKG